MAAFLRNRFETNFLQGFNCFPPRHSWQFRHKKKSLPELKIAWLNLPILLFLQPELLLNINLSLSDILKSFFKIVSLRTTTRQIRHPNRKSAGLLLGIRHCIDELSDFLFIRTIISSLLADRLFFYRNYVFTSAVGYAQDCSNLSKSIFEKNGTLMIIFLIHLYQINSFFPYGPLILAKLQIP